jgi:hypothetical protein
MQFRHKALLIALGVLAAAPAKASDKRDFEACDGLIHPGKQDDGMRGAVSQSPYSALATNRGDVIGACTRALSSPRLLNTQKLRRAHLLRARAAAYLRAGNPAKALEDLGAVDIVTETLVGDPFFQRSMALSISLLRSLAQAQSGDMASAVPLARAAMAARPYSLQVQQVGATVLQAARPAGQSVASPWLAAGRLDPALGVRALIEEAEIGNFAGVVAMRPTVRVTWPTERLKPFALAARDGAGLQMLTATFVTLHTAYARAATGDAAGARRDVAEVRAKMVELRPVSDAGPAAGYTTPIVEALDKFVETRVRQVEARLAVLEGRTSDAIGALVANPMPRDAATVELLKALKAKVPAKDAGLVPEVAAFEKDFGEDRKKDLLTVASMALIAPETPRAVVDYERARPDILGALVGGALTMGVSLLGGIDRTDGFRTTTNPDGTTKVEFIGNTPSATLVQEMTLLRAAEVARAAGKPAFVIVERKDYARRLSTMRNGMEISSVPTGFKTELTIRSVDSGAEPDRALDALAIIDALGPLYYEAKPTKG